MGVLVVDTDIASPIWRDALPDELDRQLLGQISLITFVTLGRRSRARTPAGGIPATTRNRKHFEPLEPLGLDLL